MTDERRVNLSVELDGLRGAMEHLAEAVTTSFDEDRLRMAIVEEQGRDRRMEVHRVLVAVALAFVILVALTVVGLVQTRSNHAVSDRISDCTIAGGKCYAELTRNGQAGLARLLDFIECIELVPAEGRTRAKLDICRTSALAPGSTTTTR